MIVPFFKQKRGRKAALKTADCINKLGARRFVRGRLNRGLGRKNDNPPLIKPSYLLLFPASPESGLKKALNSGATSKTEVLPA